MVFSCISLYTPIFYVVVIIFPSKCANIWDYSAMLCGAACYSFYDPFLGTFDWLFHYGTPVLIVFTANLLLFCRIIQQKIKQRRTIDWRRKKRMIIQLIFLSSLYLVLELSYWLFYKSVFTICYCKFITGNA
jgi:hypothetical protein